MLLIKMSGGMFQYVRYGIGATGPRFDVIKMADKLETLSELYVIGYSYSQIYKQLNHFAR